MFRAKPLLLVGVLAVSLLTAITPSASAAPSALSPGVAAPANGHFCAQQGVIDAKEAAHKAVCFTNYSKYLSFLSSGRIQLPAAAPARRLSDDQLAVINEPAGTNATQVLIILYDGDQYGGQQYTLTYSAGCSTSYAVQWGSMPAFDNRTTSAKMAANCHHGTLYWDNGYVLPAYPFTNAVSNVGQNFNDQTSSAKAQP